MCYSRFLMGILSLVPFAMVGRRRVKKKHRFIAVQRFRERHGLSCVFGPVWPVGAGCYSQAALPMPLSKPLYI